jgi:hypothetical protein
MEEEERLEIRIRDRRGSTVSIRVAVVVGAIVMLHGQVVVEAGTARPLTEEEKQRRLHRHFRHLPQESTVESMCIEDRGRDRYQWRNQRHCERLLDEENEKWVA